MNSKPNVSCERSTSGAGTTALAAGASSKRLGVARLMVAIGLVALFALALWFRVSSLGAFPWHNADESYIRRPDGSPPSR